MNPRISKLLRHTLDTLIPPLIRDTRWFYGPVIKLWNSRMDPDFKEKAPGMTADEFLAAYQSLSPGRKTDMTPATLQFVWQNLIGSSILEVGCGRGSVAIACAKKGFQVMATDLVPEFEVHFQEPKKYPNLCFETANLEELPFEDKQFDTTLCLHTLEHVVKLHQGIQELKRVTKKRIIVIVPKQRYFRYTADYHLHFFPSSAQLKMALDISTSYVEEIDYCLCFVGDLDA